MMRRLSSTTKPRPEAGYVLLLMVFMTALLVVTTLSAGLYIKTEAKRQKEEEMIWRGKQYVRGIKLYVRKNQGHFPTSLDDLTKPSVGNIHFMRQAYKDPMNKEDGAWRLLYVGPNGQLIGSLKPQQPGLQLGQFGGLGTPVTPLAGGQPSGPASSLQPGTPGGTSSSGGIPGATPGASQNPPGTDPGTGDSGSSSNPQPITPTDTPTIIGGNIIGIGSKVNERSIKVYEKAKNYRLFEFYWDPAKEAQAALQGAGVQTGPGQNPFGQPFSNPTNGPGQSPFGQSPSNPTNGPGSGSPGGSPTQGPGGSPPQ